MGRGSVMILTLCTTALLRNLRFPVSMVRVSVRFRVSMKKNDISRNNWIKVESATENLSSRKVNE